MPDPPGAEEFDWIRIKQDIGSKEDQSESGLQKFQRKVLENPFVPAGALLTTGCLGYGLYAMKTGQPRLSQLMMRGRILAQGATLVALCVGIAMAALKGSPNKPQAKSPTE